jgi:hypothetical protein
VGTTTKGERLSQKTEQRRKRGGTEREKLQRLKGEGRGKGAKGIK